MEQQGKTYGDFTAKEFITNILNAYTANYNRAKVKNTGVVTIENEDGTVTREALAPILIRVIEASNTGDMISLPVIKAVVKDASGIRLTDQAIQAYVNEIKAEFERIKTELNPETATYNTETGTGRLIAGYNADKMGQRPDENGRAFTFAKTGSILKTGTERETFSKDATALTSQDQLARIKGQKQKALIYDEAKANLVFSQVGDSKRTVISAKGQKVGFKTTLKNRGKIKVTLDNIDEMLDLFGEAVSVEKTDKYKYKINQGNFEGYTEGLNLAQFLSGQKELVLFEIQGGAIDNTETLEESRTASTQTVEPIESKPVINIYWGSPESSTNTRKLSNLASRKFTYEGREYGSVEHAYQSLKSGSFDQATYDKYVKKGGYGVKIRGKAVKEGFDNLQLMRDLVVQSFAQNPKQAALLLNYSEFTHTTNEVIDQAFLDGIRLAQSDAIIADAEAAIVGEQLGAEETYIPVNITKKKYTREDVRNSPNTAFVFTENNYSITAFPNRQGGGSAVIRPEENAFAIVTRKKYDYDTREKVDYADTEEDFREFVEVNTRLINELKESGKSEIVFPKGFATDKAKMPTRFAEWLQGQLRDNFGLVTELNKAKTGLISKSVDDAVSKVIVQEEVVEELNDYESQLLSALELDPEVSFEDAIGNMFEFESFLQNRLNQRILRV